jgi:hypothetical protein
MAIVGITHKAQQEKARAQRQGLLEEGDTEGFHHR